MALTDEVMENETQAQRMGEINPVSHLHHKKLRVHVSGVTPDILPPVPKSLESLGLSPSLLHKLILKHLFISGTQRTDELAQKLMIPVSLLEHPMTFLRNEAFVEGHNRIHTSIGEILHYSLTDRGRQRAHNYLEENGYVGPAPVSYAAYCEQVEKQTVRNQIIDRPGLESVFRNVVIPPQVLRQIGAAFNSGNSIFLFGPAGTGKTFLASQVVKLLQGDVLIPYAIEAEGQIIRVFDPTNHHEVVTSEGGARLLISREEGENFDRRWVRCKRPVIVAAGELTLEMLELKYQTFTGYYDAPLQMKANGGIFLIDDLGRQVVNTSQLLNRWILPLENNVDYLNMHTGVKLKIPFDVIPIFSTNISPDELADEAFLRRLGYKVHIDYISEEDFGTIFRQYCEANEVEYDAEMVKFLITEYYQPRKKRMAASHPKELVNKVIDFSLYEGIKPHITKEMLAQAWDSYFLT